METITKIDQRREALKQVSIRDLCEIVTQIDRSKYEELRDADIPAEQFIAAMVDVVAEVTVH
jgi:hypothetical protein